MSAPRDLRKTTRAGLILMGAFLVWGVVSVGPAAAAQCDPAADENCVSVVITNDQLPPSPPNYSVVFIDDRQFTALLFFSALTAAITLASFVWRASSGLSLRGK